MLYCRVHYLTAESLSLAEEWVMLLQDIIQRNALRYDHEVSRWYDWL